MERAIRRWFLTRYPSLRTKLMLSLRSLFLVATIALAGAACQWQRHSENVDQTKGSKINFLHQGDPNLAGIFIYQNDPVNMDGYPPRNKGDHPFGIVYYFWDDTHVRDVAYDKEGEIVRDTRRTCFTPTSKSQWSRVNFSYGSDPAFERHADPRGR